MLAELTINFLVFENDMTFDDLHVFILLEPLPEALEMDSAHGARAVARGDHGVELIIGVIIDAIIVVEAYATDHGRLGRLLGLMRLGAGYSFHSLLAIIPLSFEVVTLLL